MLKIDGFDRSLLGIAVVWQKHESGGAERVETLVYDGEKIVTTLCEQSGLSYDEAMEYISFNIEGAYVGKATPIIVWGCDMEYVNEIADNRSDEAGE